MQTELFIELNGEQVDTAVFMDNVKEYWKSEGNKIKDLKSVSIYYKPEESMCYYVLNGDIKGSFQV